MRINTDLRYNEDEYDTVRAYLSAMGLKTGPYLRAKLLNEANDWERIATGSTQIDIAVLRGIGGKA